jgi:hypothetical protein
MQQLFLCRARAFLDLISNAELRTHVAIYAALLRTTGHEGVREKAETSVAMDVLWRTHMVHPRIYATDCGSKGAFPP